MPSDIVGVAAVERRVKRQVQKLSALAALLRDFTQSHDKYAHEYSKLPLEAPQDGDALAKYPPLRGVVQTLEKSLAATSQAHVALASELSATVLMPIEAFERQQRHQTKQLLAEIDDALQTERQLHQSMKSGLRKGRARLAKQRSRSSSVGKREETNQEPEECQSVEEPAIQDESPAQTQDERWVTKLKEIKEKRDCARATVQQRLAELDLTHEQQTAVVHAQLTQCFDVLARHTTRILTETAELTSSFVSSASASSSSTALMGADLKELLEAFDLHVDVTNWMILLFAQVLSVEDATTKRLQTLSRAHALVTITAAFPPASATSAESTTLWGLVQSHRQLLSNLSDPIGRTLRFSKQKQETICKELLESMDETQKLVQLARAKVRDKETKLLQSPYQSQNQTQSRSELLGATSTDATMASSFGLRSAVVAWTRQLQSPKKPLSKPKAMLLSEETRHGSLRETSAVLPLPATPQSAEILNLEKELCDAKRYLEMLETNEAAQRSEMISTLQNTALIGVKTTELMVQDHLRNVSKAMQLATVAIAKSSEPRSPSETDTFASVVLFDDDTDCATSSEWRELVGGGEDERGAEKAAPAPEQTTSETETESVAVDEMDEDEENATSDSLVPIVGSSSSPGSGYSGDRATTSLNTLTAMWESLGLDAFLQQATTFANKIVPVLARSLETILHRVARSSPDQWRLVGMLVLIGSVAHVAVRIGRLQREYQELVAVQAESAHDLQELLHLMARSIAH